MIVLFVLALAAALSAALVLALFPVMRRYALARPNARSSHRVPTPQGGGIAVVGATLLVGAAAVLVVGLTPGAGTEVLVLAGATLLLAVIGAVDDIRPLPVLPRLVLQAVSVAAVVLAASATGRVLGLDVPLWLEVAVATLAGLWFVNLTNFMDGLDWLTVAAMVPTTATIAALGQAGIIVGPQGLVAAALLGALLGFAPFNRPVARLFLGDVGSLPIGLVVAWLLFGLAAQGHVVAAILLPLYSCSDATLTLLRRAARREPVWQAHRSHYYQRAGDLGFGALEISGTIFVANVVLAVLAVGSILVEGLAADLAALVLGGAVVAGLLLRFGRSRARLEATR
ncbi:glycosyl transferase [Salinarimonas rosea]|uniref:glycosyl transferase n=1 Tax=Salinarimonas rosea TaxID=552063 RepID=UPI0003FB79A1|nr:glycosyl transferase [Salinarimonas rosea]